jgi:hypothetical protein
VSLGTGRIVVIVALVVGGVALLANGFSDAAPNVAAPSGTQSTTPTATTTPTTGPTATDSPVSTPAPLPPAKVVIAVFNGTTALGLAAQGQLTLTDAGYKAGPGSPANSPVPGVQKTVVYFRTGTSADAAQNQSDAQAIADKYFKGAKVLELGPDYETAVDKTVQVVVVLGQDYADANPA